MSAACTPVRSLLRLLRVTAALTRRRIQAHDWFSDVLTGGLILGLCISYAPQVCIAPQVAPFD